MAKHSFSITISDTAVSVLMVLLGLLIIFFPGETLATLVRIVGIAVLVFGVVCIIRYVTKKPGSRNSGTLIFGIILALLGTYTVVQPGSIISFVAVVAGIVIILVGAKNIYEAFRLKTRSHHWWIEVLLGIAIVALGIVVLFNPFSTQKILFIILGIVLVYQGINRIVVLRKRK